MRKMSQANVPVRTAERLFLYQRVLERWPRTAPYVCSRELAERLGNTPAQVRRDLMFVGCAGDPVRGYSVADLSEALRRFFRRARRRRAALVGVGKLGRALLSYFALLKARPRIVAAFDNDPAKARGRIEGCPCFLVDRVSQIVPSKKITVAILTVPASAAQSVADSLVLAGVRGILNFAPVPLKVPAEVYVEHVDLSLKLEKAAFFCEE